MRNLFDKQCMAVLCMTLIMGFAHGQSEKLNFSFNTTEAKILLNETDVTNHRVVTMTPFLGMPDRSARPDGKQLMMYDKLGLSIDSVATKTLSYRFYFLTDSVTTTYNKFKGSVKINGVEISEESTSDNVKAAFLNDKSLFEMPGMGFIYIHSGVVASIFVTDNKVSRILFGYSSVPTKK